MIATINHSISLTKANANAFVSMHWRAPKSSPTRSSRAKINYVFSRFMGSFLRLFWNTASSPSAFPSLSPRTSALVGQMLLRLDIYYDLACQQLPPIEDACRAHGPEHFWVVRMPSWNAGTLG